MKKTEKEIKGEIKYRKEVIAEAKKGMAGLQKLIDNNTERLANLEEQLKAK